MTLGEAVELSGSIHTRPWVGIMALETFSLSPKTPEMVFTDTFYIIIFLIETRMTDCFF